MDLKHHLLRQMAFSHANWGPGRRTDQIIKHIKKELVEIEESNGSVDEWVDVVLLALDGMTRQLYYGGDKRRCPDTVSSSVCEIIKNKQTINEHRQWPDWRTADLTQPMEHIE